MNKSIYFTTNLNGKLHSNTLIHLDKSPTGSYPESVANKTVFTIHTKDASHPPTQWQLVDVCGPLIMRNLPNAFTLLSHGMDQFDFLQYFKTLYPDADFNTKIHAYFFTKILFTDNHKPA